ncbi:hypothetical protein F0169_03100 [Pseudomonas sp. MAFF 212408]|uniref:Uncharacterized protein n=1 Tax=Pseudomonas kitaguniensis TaxID=2607908 RepID=A0A5N7KHM4_9PSED|nr:hypothetical protein [Pseudomonas kitaguniensis]
MSAYTAGSRCALCASLTAPVPTKRLAAMYPGQMGMTTTNGEIRCQRVVQIICFLSVASLFC